MTDLVSLKKEAKSKKTSASRLEELSRHADSSVQLAVVGNPNTPAATLEYLGRLTKLSVLKALAKNPNTPPHILERLMRHRHDTVRQAVAQSAQISETIALELLTDVSEHTRFLVMKHSRRFKWNTLRLFESAARDPSSLVRMTVADHATVSSVLEGLLDDANWRVVAYALANPALALTVLTAQLEGAFERLNSTEHWLEASQIVQRRDLPAHWLERFVAHPHTIVRSFVAKNPNAPEEIAAQLARERNWHMLSTPIR